MSFVCVLGSSYGEVDRERWGLRPCQVDTPLGEVTLWEVTSSPRQAYVLFRHGISHRYLPNQIPYRAHTLAIKAIGCTGLVVTSSVGVLDPSTPLYTPMLVKDLLMPDNRLPDGTACSMFTEPSPQQGHLVLEEGLCSRALSRQIRDLATRHGVELAEQEVIFAYVGGPRTKTRAENAFWKAMGAQVNSMTLAPEIVLANELEIPCAGLVVGHKRSSAEGQKIPDVEGAQSVTRSLESSREATDALLSLLLTHLTPVPFANHIYRFTSP